MKTNYTPEELQEMMDRNNGNLYLTNTKIKSLPDNLIVGGGLHLRFTPIKKLPDNLTVGGFLDLNNTPIKSLPDILTVGGSLDLENTPIEKLPDNLIVGGNLYLRCTQIKSLPDNLTVGGFLDLSHTQIKSLPNNLTVGGTLDLYDTPIKSLPDNLTVSGNLYLTDTPIKSLPDNLTVGGWIHFNGDISNVKKLHNGDYVEGRYLYADEILTHIKRKKQIGDYTYYIGKIPNRNVISDGTYYAHCENFRQGIEDLRVKHMTDKELSEYKSLSLDSILSKDEAIAMYRAITGACRHGTEMFINSLKEVKKSYTIQEIIDMTERRYGHETFKEFFNKQNL